MVGHVHADTQPTVAIDCFPERLAHYHDHDVVVAVDVFRTSTTAVTALDLGRRCFPVPNIEAATERAATMPDALLAGELGGHVPFGFEIDNSPSALLTRSDVHRPMILLSTSGTRVICGTQPSQIVYVACLRNIRAQVVHILAMETSPSRRVAVVGAGARGEFRDEDALCCGWIAHGLVEGGYRAENTATEELIDRWRSAPVDVIARGNSAAFLRRVGRDDDIEFTLTHVDDLTTVSRFVGDELILEPTVSPSREFRSTP